MAGSTCSGATLATFGCMSGRYAFKTQTPLFSRWAAAGGPESGELVINGDVVTKFDTAATTPPGLPVR